MKYVLFIAAFLWGLTAYSQDHATCDDAISITTSSYGPITPSGFADSSLCSPTNKNMYFGKSHLVVWFSFIAPYDTTLTFQIVPENSGDDFDFILFRADRGDFCQKEKQRQVEPIRTNFAKPTVYNKGITGLSAAATDAMVAPGYKSSYSSSVQIKKGEWYYLVVDSYKNNKGGFTLHIPLRFNMNTPQKSTIDAAPVKPLPPLHPGPRPNFIIHVLDSLGKPIKANIFVEGILHSRAIKADTANYSFVVKKFQNIKIRIAAVGHMPYQSSYTNNGDTATVTFWARLDPIRSGEKITLKDIQFAENSAGILPISKQALDYILQFLISNPKVKILIKGYTNDPKHKQSKKYDLALSEERTNAVLTYLASRHINKSRMKCVGYGSIDMLYPKPKNAEQEAANRRVEIEIL